MPKYTVDAKFSLYAPYENLPDCTWDLGTISLEQSYEILEKIRELSVQPCITRNRCLRGISATHNASISTGIPHDTVRSNLELEPSFEYSDDGIKLACSSKTFSAYDQEKMINKCYKCLRHGNCVDTFMIETIGKVFFPQFYAKQKTK